MVQRARKEGDALAMPRDFRVNIKATIGPENIKYSGTNSCRELWLTDFYSYFYTTILIRASKSYDIYNALSRAHYTAPSVFAHLVQDDIREVHAELECYSERTLQQLLMLAPELIERYNNTIAISSRAHKDEFVGITTHYISIQSANENALAALWWMVLLNRLTYTAFVTGRRKRFYKCISRMIEMSKAGDKDLWYRVDDKEMHLRLWNYSHEYEATNEMPFGKWAMGGGNGPCNCVAFVGSYFEELAVQYNLRGLLRKLYQK